MCDLSLCVVRRMRVYVRSEGCDDKIRGRRVSRCGRARFRVNGRDYSPPRGSRGRGFNIVVIDGMTGKLIMNSLIKNLPSFFVISAEVSVLNDSD